MDIATKDPKKVYEQYVNHQFQLSGVDGFNATFICTTDEKIALKGIIDQRTELESVMYLQDISVELENIKYFNI